VCAVMPGMRCLRVTAMYTISHGRPLASQRLQDLWLAFSSPGAKAVARHV